MGCMYHGEPGCLESSRRNGKKLRKKTVGISIEILNNLRSAKVLLEITDSSANHEETAIKIERYLENVEIYVFSEIQERFEVKTVEVWLKQLAEAQCREDQSIEENKFISGITRNQKWIRVKPFQNYLQKT
jgi:hypothetical protein